VNISIIENLVTVIYHKARNAFLNKNVFSPVLKESSVCVALRWSGRLFHRRGAAEQKARLLWASVIRLTHLETLPHSTHTHTATPLPTPGEVTRARPAPGGLPQKLNSRQHKWHLKVNTCDESDEEAWCVC